MGNDLTQKQKRFLDYISSYIEEKGYPPSVREICQATGLTSTATAHGYLTRLEQKGYIKREGAKNRAFRLTARCEQPKPAAAAETRYADIPVIGKVAAGQPLLAFEDYSGTFPYPIEFLKNDDYFMLEISGNSMEKIGILDGDFVLVRKTSTARNGDVVVALIGDEATVKRFYKENGHYRLQPENDSMDPIIVDSLTILGEVSGLIRTSIS
ncbi:MAG: transcriptional repressor LexA [Eubacteriales bacterium]|nr:transcriptional repressor LexA [Eubacteriales bacterium]